MPNVAIVLNGEVLNVSYFNTSEEARTFDYSLFAGPGTLGIELSGDQPVSKGWKYDGEKFIAPPPPEPTHGEYVGLATIEKEKREAEARAKLFDWMKIQILDGSDPEASSIVSEWDDYLDSLASLDLELAPDITWPESPKSLEDLKK